jgi:hypothetical protein
MLELLARCEPLRPSNHLVDTRTPLPLVPRQRVPEWRCSLEESPKNKRVFDRKTQRQAGADLGELWSLLIDVGL